MSSSLKEEAMGIVSILGSDSEKPKSLRRTLSADMSSRKWQSLHGFSPLKRIASSREFPVQEENDQKDPPQFDVWTSILSQKPQEDSQTLYVHPLVKRSASSLSEKSLEICTESLGSETGSEGLISSYPPSETEDEEEICISKYEMVDWVEGKCNNHAAAKKSSSAKVFPPPLPSLSTLDGASLHMRPRRDNGRFVLEAVSVPSQNNFRAQRHEGRLVLTFVKQENDTKTEEEDGRFAMEEAPKLSGGLINVHRLAMMMNKPMVLSNRKLGGDDLVGIISKPAPTPLNNYWKGKALGTAIHSNTIKSSNEKQELVGLSKGCKQPRRSLLFWESYCIATS